MGAGWESRYQENWQTLGANRVTDRPRGWLDVRRNRDCIGAGIQAGPIRSARNAQRDCWHGGACSVAGAVGGLSIIARLYPSTHVARMPQRITPRLGPYRESMRLSSDGNLVHCTRCRVDHIDDI